MLKDLGINIVHTCSTLDFCSIANLTPQMSCDSCVINSLAYNQTYQLTQKKKKKFLNRQIHDDEQSKWK